MMTYELQKRSVFRYKGQYGCDVTLPPCNGLDSSTGLKCGSKRKTVEVRHADSNYIEPQTIWRCLDCSWPFECEGIYLR